MSFPPPRRLPKTVKRTTGGTFDPNQPSMFFVASNPAQIIRSTIPNVLVAVNELDTKANRENFDRMLDEGRKVMLDSGIFNLAMEHVRKHGVTHDEALGMPPDEIDGFDRLWDSYGEVVTTYGSRLWGIVELDQGGVDNKPVTRARIEKEFGITPMPVYHPLLDGWDYYDTLAKGYDRICFGNIVQAAPPHRLRLVHTAFERARQYPYLWTHLLGLYPNQNTLSLRMRGSSDASSWLTPVRWYPSWRGWSMLNMETAYPTSMWSHKGTASEDASGTDGYDRADGERICAHTADAANMILTATLEDTHP